MKTSILAFSMLFSAGLLMAAEMIYTSNVYGNCGMCKERIENAIKAVKGVNNADWNPKNRVVTLSFDNELTNIYKIHKAIAKAGHDTDMYQASDNAYARLQECCQYVRAKQSEHRMQTYPDEKRIVMYFNSKEAYDNFLNQQINN
ncbi:heavy-metal-associated domain-containing protein [Carboxylicivirga mesophila]|uniref:Heavy-metal-associated domain-containing protein n=1 Tax=Carboxylicivirga mesophila TaxID=1166478 RepID=A0ABS5KCD6_9BACT|nr:heavy-metal-associated domain-containing protein [Carboxylicivirga mesophila]MBS2212653.1 heavy-metal-associated domain-containing protein [Carboxylicivirga mesophila]